MRVASRAAESALLAALVLALAVAADAWVPPLGGAAAVTASTPDSPVAGPVAWPVASIPPPAEGCMSPALSVIKVVAVVLGALAAIKLPLVLAKLLLAKVLLLLPLALPLALPLLVPFMMLAAAMPLPGMDDGPAATPAPANPAAPPAAGPAGGGNASPVTPSGDETEARGVWVERCIQRMACQLNSKGSRRECARYRCAAIDWMGGT